eukprot:jgi/Chrzof1/9711/Cz04g13020.t1
MSGNGCMPAMEASEGLKEPTYSFSKWWLNTELADVEVTIIEGEGSDAQATPKTRANKRRLQQSESNNSITIPAHGLILSEGSEYFRTQLNTRVGPNTNGSKVCSLEVERGELNVAKAVIQSLYMGIPGTLTQGELITACKLADRLQASITVASCGKVLSSIPIEQFEWDTVLTVFQQPPFCLEADAFKPAVQKAVDKLILVLGDLEAVMNEEQLRELLLGLPCPAMAALLASSHLKVASENSAAAAVFAWVHANGGPEQVGQAQLKQLVNQLRLSHMSHMYAVELLQHGGWFVDTVGVSTLARLASLCAVGTAGSIKTQLQNLLQQQHVPDAWLAPARPASARVMSSFTMTLSALELQELLRDKGKKWSEPIFHCGCHIDFIACFELKETPNAEPCHHLAVYARLVKKAGVPTLPVCCSTSVMTQKRPNPRVYTFPGFVLDHTGHGLRNFLGVSVSQPSDIPNQLSEFLINDKVTVTFEFREVL